MKKWGRCENCHKRVPPGEILYEIRIDIYAKGGPVEIEPEDLDKDHIAEMQRLIARMEHMDVEELTDQVWESYKFDLCSQCRKEFHANLKLKKTGRLPQRERSED